MLTKDLREARVYQEYELAGQKYRAIKAVPDFSDLDLGASWVNIDPTLFHGMLLSVSIIDHETKSIFVHGSAALTYSTYCLCATHVLQDYMDKIKQGLASVYLTGYYPKGPVMWQGTRFIGYRGLDIGLLEIIPTFKAEDVPVVICTEMEFKMPAVGDRIFISGTIADEPEYSLNENKINPPAVQTRLCQGRVIDVYPNGRDRTFLPMPCFAVDTPSWGGMSGGPAFNGQGELIGLISRSFDTAPTTVSLIPNPESALTEKMLRKD